jgi:hypothetical protein
MDEIAAKRATQEGDREAATEDASVVTNKAEASGSPHQKEIPYEFASSSRLENKQTGSCSLVFASASPH